MSVLRRQTWTSMTAPDRASLFARGLDDIFEPGLRASIEHLVDDVRNRGDAAICDALARFDGIELTPAELPVTSDQIEAASVNPEVDAAIDDAIAHLRAFNEQQLTHFGDWSFESEPGLMVGEKIGPIASAGLYVPSGKASYPSVAYQLAVPALVAGVRQIVMVVPPAPGGAGEVDPAVLVVCRKLGLTPANGHGVFRANGPAGIAAMGLGTESIPKVLKLMGPGSPATTVTQIELRRHGVETVLLLGPTESVVVADHTADAERLAADLLIEAEHGSDSSVVLVCTDSALVESVDAALARQLADLPAVRADAARASLGPNGGAVLVPDLATAVEVANRYAPEHLQVAVADAAVDAVVAALTNAGEILIGQHTPFSAANFVIGCPAALPTSGYAHVTSGVTAATFLKRTAVARADGAALARMTPSVVALADHEGFPAHAAALRRRAAIG
jgi:histidinol dehydrogenase